VKLKTIGQLVVPPLLLTVGVAAYAQTFTNQELRNSAAPDKCITAPKDAADNMQLVVQPCTGSPNQRFTLHPDGHLQSAVKNPQGYDLCVDYYPAQGNDGSPVRLFRCRPFGGGIDSHRWSWDGARLRGAHGTYVSVSGGEAALTSTAHVVMSRSTSQTSQWVFNKPGTTPANPPNVAVPGGSDRSGTLPPVPAPTPKPSGPSSFWCADSPPTCAVVERNGQKYVVDYCDFPQGGSRPCSPEGSAKLFCAENGYNYSTTNRSKLSQNPLGLRTWHLGANAACTRDCATLSQISCRSQ
jgi:hypothetical protein